MDVGVVCAKVGLGYQQVILDIPLTQDHRRARSSFRRSWVVFHDKDCKVPEVSIVHNLAHSDDWSFECLHEKKTKPGMDTMAEWWYDGMVAI